MVRISYIHFESYSSEALVIMPQWQLKVLLFCEGL